VYTFNPSLICVVVGVCVICAPSLSPPTPSLLVRSGNYLSVSKAVLWWYSSLVVLRTVLAVRLSVRSLSRPVSFVTSAPYFLGHTPHPHIRGDCAPREKVIQTPQVTVESENLSTLHSSLDAVSISAHVPHAHAHAHTPQSPTLLTFTESSHSIVLTFYKPIT
jgi:hypothetical protein